MPEPPSEQAFPQTPAQLPEQRAEHVRLQAQAALESRLQPLVDALLQEQGQWLLSQLKRELAPMVQQAVAEAMAVQQKQTVF